MLTEPFLCTQIFRVLRSRGIRNYSQAIGKSSFKGSRFSVELIRAFVQITRAVDLQNIWDEQSTNETMAPLFGNSNLYLQFAGQVSS